MLGQRDDVPHRIGREIWRRREEERRLDETTDRRKLGKGIVGHFLLEAEIDRQRAHRFDPDRVTVGRRPRDSFDTGDAAGAGAVLDHDRLSKLAFHIGLDRPRQDIGAATRRKGHDQPNRPRRVAMPGSRRRSSRRV